MAMRRGGGRGGGRDGGGGRWRTAEEVGQEEINEMREDGMVRKTWKLQKNSVLAVNA